jgi:hypothetical protein
MIESPEDRFDRLGSAEFYTAATRTRDRRYPSRFGLLTWPEINFEPKDDTFIKGLLTSGAFSVVYGESGSGKTHFETDCALHVALGSLWFGRKVIQGGVVYIAAEGGRSMRRRVAAFRKHHALQLDQDIPFALIPSAVNLLDPHADLPELLDLIKTVAAGMRVPLRLVVVDTLSCALAGGNENAPNDMGAFVRSIDRIREQTGTHVSIIHHSGKTPGQGARGHSLLRAAADTEIEVSKQEAAGHSIARVTKQRDGANGDAFAFSLRRVELGLDEDNEPLSSCVVIPIGGVADVKATKTLQRTIPPEYLKALNYLNDVMVEHREFIVASGIPSGTPVVHVDRWRDHLKQRGLHEGGEKGKKWFQRVRTWLIAHDRIVNDGSYVWIVK